MKTDYQFLIGRDFFVGEDVYTVHNVAWNEELAFVQAGAKDSTPTSSVLPDAAARGRFPVNQVLQWLLVEEEIELFNPNYLGVAGS